MILPGLNSTMTAMASTSLNPFGSFFTSIKKPVSIKSPEMHLPFFVGRQFIKSWTNHHKKNT